MLRPLQRVLIACLLATSSGLAQIVTEEQVTTDSVELFAPVQQARKSAGLAMAATLLLPGLGHEYLGRRGRALAYFSTEVLVVFGAVLCERYSQRMYEDARTYAWTYAGAGGGPGSDDVYWQDMGHYMDSRGYNQVQEQQGTPAEKYLDPRLQWAWVDEQHMDEYVARREDATSFHVASGFFVAAMVLNRVVSFIDVRISTLRHTGRGGSAVRIEPRYSPRSGALSLTLTRAF